MLDSVPLPSSHGDASVRPTGITMNDKPTILSLFAHPDDETFLTAGTMAHFRDLGSNVVVCSATRGEEGEIAAGVPASRETLGAFREQELRTAMAMIGVTDVRFLGYRDSGMQGTETNAAPDAFMQAAIEETSEVVADLIDDVRPDIVMTFSPEGIYLHPDHIAVHKAVVRAAAIAGKDRSRHRPGALLFATAPREWFLEMWQVEDNPFAELPFETIEQMGVPLAELTHVVDVGDHRERIYEALRAHASQFGTGDPLERIPENIATAFLNHNHFQQSPLTWNGTAALPSVFRPMNR